MALFNGSTYVRVLVALKAPKIIERLRNARIHLSWDSANRSTFHLCFAVT